MGKTKWLGIGIVHEGYDINETMPGWESESVGYHTDDGRIFHNDNYSGMETEGIAMRPLQLSIPDKILRNLATENLGC